MASSTILARTASTCAAETTMPSSRNSRFEDLIGDEAA